MVYLEDESVRNVESLKVTNDNLKLFFKNMYCKYISRFLQISKRLHSINSSIEEITRKNFYNKQKIHKRKIIGTPKKYSNISNRKKTSMSKIEVRVTHILEDYYIVV